MFPQRTHLNTKPLTDQALSTYYDLYSPFFPALILDLHTEKKSVPVSREKVFY